MKRETVYLSSICFKPVNMDGTFKFDENGRTMHEQCAKDRPLYTARKKQGSWETLKQNVASILRRRTA